MKHEPSIHEVVDVLTARMEATTDPAEREACRDALVRIEAYIFRESRILGWIERVIRHIARRPAA